MKKLRKNSNLRGDEQKIRILEEMDYATCQLDYNLTAIGHKVWRKISIIVILRSSGRVVPLLGADRFLIDDFLMGNNA